MKLFKIHSSIILSSFLIPLLIFLVLFFWEHLPENSIIFNLTILATCGAIFFLLKLLKTYSGITYSGIISLWLVAMIIWAFISELNLLNFKLYIDRPLSQDSCEFVYFGYDGLTYYTDFENTDNGYWEGIKINRVGNYLEIWNTHALEFIDPSIFYDNPEVSFGYCLNDERYAAARHFIYFGSSKRPIFNPFQKLLSIFSVFFKGFWRSSIILALITILAALTRPKYIISE